MAVAICPSEYSSYNKVLPSIYEVNSMLYYLDKAVNLRGDRGGQSLRAILRVGEGARSGWRAVDHADHSRAVLRAAPFRRSHGRATGDQHSGTDRATEPSRGCAIDHPSNVAASGRVEGLCAHRRRSRAWPSDRSTRGLGGSNPCRQPSKAHRSVSSRLGAALPP